ncbi:hypothetical protein [Komagataeibacter xylinus]|uniref:hypothetical protein n=1 Tax=Komagataeibacter xylinus TaxID=28448 RepID=UPI00102FD221|nr:hypothetical protein [Komagataeibacter xylinus]
MSETPRDRVHAVVCDLGCLHTILDGLIAASEPPPLEFLAGWVKRIYGELDRAWLGLPTDGGQAE